MGKSNREGQCTATTNAGERCRHRSQGIYGGLALCARHLGKAKTKRGGGRKGSGRKRKGEDEYQELFRALGEPPTDNPLELCVWAQSASANALWLTVMGQGNEGLNREIRAFANVIQKLVPLERVALVEKLLKGRYQAKKPRETTGPEVTKDALKPGSNRGPLRR